MNYEAMTEYMGYKIGDEVVMHTPIGDKRQPVRGTVTGFTGPQNITTTASTGQIVMKDANGVRRVEPPLFTSHA